MAESWDVSADGFPLARSSGVLMHENDGNFYLESARPTSKKNPAPPPATIPVSA